MENKRFICEDKMESTTYIELRLRLFRLIFGIMLGIFLLFSILLIIGFTQNTRSLDSRQILITVLFFAFLFFILWVCYYAFTIWQKLKKDIVQRQVLLYKNRLKRHFKHNNGRLTIEFQYRGDYSIRTYIPQKRFRELRQGDQVIVVIGKYSKEVLDVYKNHGE